MKRSLRKRNRVRLRRLRNRITIHGALARQVAVSRPGSAPAQPRTAVVMLTWNRLPILKNTIATFRNHHDVHDQDFIVVDNGSTDGTQAFLKRSSFDLLLNRRNLGAQAGKLLGWQRAVQRGYDFILFIEDDHPCVRTVPLAALEGYLDRNPDVGLARMNDKAYFTHHMITRLPVEYQDPVPLVGDFETQKSSYHFTSHPALFRTSLVRMIDGCVLARWRPRPADFERLCVEIYDGEDRALRTRRKVLEDFGIMEREYMRRFLLHYRVIAQLTPPCFEWARDSVASARKNTKAWRN